MYWEFPPRASPGRDPRSIPAGRGLRHSLRHGGSGTGPKPPQAAHPAIQAARPTNSKDTGTYSAGPWAPLCRRRGESSTMPELERPCARECLPAPPSEGAKLCSATRRRPPLLPGCHLRS
eukprot:scaffold2560_cov397-Prasinococcus_capsulatus_cf.AAC.9